MTPRTNVPEAVPELEHAKGGVYVCPVCDHIGTGPVPCPTCLKRWEDGE